MAGGEEGVDPALGRFENRLDGRRDQHLADEHGEVGQTTSTRLVDGHGVGRRRRLETDGEEDDLTVGLGFGDVDRIERRVHDPDVGSAGPCRVEIAVRSGYPQHVTERAEDDVGSSRQLQAPVDRLERGHTDRAAGAVNELDLGRQELVDAVTDDRVGLPAADLHDRPVAGRCRRDLVQDAAGQLRIAELVEILHDPPSPGSSAPISANRARESRAAASSRTVMENPAWTIT